MSMGLITLIVVVAFFALMILGLPIAFCLITTSVLAAVVFWDPAALYVVPTTIYSQGTKEVLLAIPLFVFLAAVLERSGIAESLYDLFYKWLGRLGGGLAIACVVICTIIDAISGLGASGIVTIGPIGLKEMFKRNYHKHMALGCITAGSALGPLIPPSVVMIIIAGFTGLSVGKLFAGGLIPGLLCSAGFIVYIVVACFIKPSLAPPIEKTITITWTDRLVALRSVILPVCLISAIMGSIYVGITTPTEGAGVGAFGALVCAAINGKLTPRVIYDAGMSSVKTTCMVMWLLIAGSLFSSLLNAIGVQGVISQLLVGVNAAHGRMAVLLIMMLIVFIMGMFIDGAAITVLTMPVFFPVVITAGIDPLWFGILFTINIVTGYLTPPFGMNLFYMKGITPPDVTMLDIYKSVIPYIAVMIVVLILTIFFPPLATWFPNAVMG